MPEYLFVNINEPNEVSLRVYHMNDAPSVGSIIEDPMTGVRWKRVFTKPQMAVDAVAIDPYKAADFVKATNKRGTMGDMWDRSAELSAKRADKEGGRDPVKEKFYDNYAKKRKHQHPQRMREEGTRRLKEKNITIDWGDQ